MTAPTVGPLDVVSIAADWYRDFVAEGGRASRGVEWIVTNAESKAQQYAELGTAYDDFQPGNGTSYKLVLHDLIAPYVRLMADADLASAAERAEIDWDTTGRLAWLSGLRQRTQMADSELWESAASHTMASRVGGELLVSLPETAGGRCGVFSVHDGAVFVPGYVAERLGLRYGDAVPLAVYLTAFVNRVARNRDER